MNFKYLLVNGWDVKFFNKQEVAPHEESPDNENAVKIQKGKVLMYFKPKKALTEEEEEIERWYEDAVGWEVIISTLTKNGFICQQILHVGRCDIEIAVGRIWERQMTVGEMLTHMAE